MLKNQKLTIVRWLMIAGYVSVFLILGRYHVQMSKFNKFFGIIMISTFLLVALLWFLRNKKGGKLTNRD